MNKNQIKWGAALSYAAIAINILAGLIYTPWMVDRIGKGDYGLFTLANSLITLFLVDFGLGSATSKYVAKYRAEGRQDKVNNFLGIIYRLYCAIDAVICVVLIAVFFLIDSIYVKLSPEELVKFKIVYIIAASFAVANFPFVTFNGILNAYEKFIELKLGNIMHRILLVAITVAALCTGYGLYALVAIQAGVGLFLIVYKYIIIKKHISIKPYFRYRDTSLYKEIFNFSIWITISLLSSRLIFNITPSILGAVANSSAIAVFGIITTIEGYAYTITSAIDGIFLPKITKIYESDGSAKNIMPLYLNVGRFQFVLNGLILVGFAVVGKQFIRLWMGSDYLDAYYGLLLVLMPGMFYNSMQIANTAMLVQDKVNLQAVVNILTGIINVLLSIPLSKRYGVIGASLSICIAYFFRVIALNIIAWKAMEFDVPCFVRDCYLRLSMPVVCTIILGVVLNRMITETGWVTLVIKGILVATVYFFFVIIIGIRKTERIKLTNKLTQIIKKR